MKRVDVEKSPSELAQDASGEFEQNRNTALAVGIGSLALLSEALGVPGSVGANVSGILASVSFVSLAAAGYAEAARRWSSNYASRHFEE